MSYPIKLTTVRLRCAAKLEISLWHPLVPSLDGLADAKLVKPGGCSPQRPSQEISRCLFIEAEEEFTSRRLAWELSTQQCC